MPSTFTTTQAGCIINLLLLLFLFKFSCGNLKRSPDIHKWDNAVVPYTLSHLFTRDEAIVIFKAFDSISNMTCVKFIPLSNETDFVFIHKGNSRTGCYAALGRIGGPQILHLEVDTHSHGQTHTVRNCVQPGLLEYQLMRTLGFYQEHLRPDRDDFIDIEWRNVVPRKKADLQKYSTALFNLTALPYDYSSITHGNLYAFAKGHDDFSIVPKKYGVSIGQRQELSDGDIQKILTVYCNASIKMSCVPILSLFIGLILTILYI